MGATPRLWRHEGNRREGKWTFPNAVGECGHDTVRSGKACEVRESVPRRPGKWRADGSRGAGVGEFDSWMVPDFAQTELKCDSPLHKKTLVPNDRRHGTGSAPHARRALQPLWCRGAICLRCACTVAPAWRGSGATPACRDGVAPRWRAERAVAPRLRGGGVAPSPGAAPLVQARGAVLRGPHVGVPLNGRRVEQ